MTIQAKRPSKGKMPSKQDETPEEMRDRLMRDVTEVGEKEEEPPAQAKMKRLNVEIEESLAKRLKIKAAQEGRSIADITRAALIDHLNK